MATIQELILARLLAIAQSVPGVITASRSRRTGVDREETPAVIVRPGDEQDERFGAQADEHRFLPELIVMTRGEPWDTAADPIVDALHTAVMRDATLRSMSMDMRRIARESEDTEADGTAGQYTLRYQITYLTRVDQLGAQP